MSLSYKYLRSIVVTMLGLLTWYAPPARADAALLLEEPYGHFGAFTATGHAAVYLTNICADSPDKLRRCHDEEAGVVISRYNKVAGRDWLAIPLIPYLYAVEESDEIPLFANPKIVAFLRNQYRRNHLEAVAPDDPTGEPPEGNWTQLVGAAYDRTIYGFQIQTTAEQDDQFIQAYNSRVNRAHFNLITHNCADFAASVVNFYYPDTLHRNLIADAGITTPKQIAKLLVKFSKRHPELQSSSFVIPQVPGTLPRSTAVHGVVESVLKSKKYLLPVAVLHPVVTGFLAAAYIGDGRFDPKRQAMILEADRDLQPPLLSNDRRDYRNELRALTAKHERSWTALQASADPQLDQDGRPVLRMRLGQEIVAVGIARDNILNTSSPLAKDLVMARLQSELRNGGDPRASEVDVRSDWKLLHQLTLVDKTLN
jgi:hypothetical protein